MKIGSFKCPEERPGKGLCKYLILTPLSHLHRAIELWIVQRMQERMLSRMFSHQRSKFFSDSSDFPTNGHRCWCSQRAAPTPFGLQYHRMYFRCNYISLGLFCPIHIFSIECSWFDCLLLIECFCRFLLSDFPASLVFVSWWTNWGNKLPLLCSQCLGVSFTTTSIAQKCKDAIAFLILFSTINHLSAIADQVVSSWIGELNFLFMGSAAAPGDADADLMSRWMEWK